MIGLLVFPQADWMLAELHHGVVITSLAPMTIGADAQSVHIALPTASGAWVTGRCDLSLFLTAADVFIATHGDPRTGMDRSRRRSSGRGPHRGPVVRAGE